MVVLIHCHGVWVMALVWISRDSMRLSMGSRGHVVILIVILVVKVILVVVLLIVQVIFTERILRVFFRACIVRAIFLFAVGIFL